MTEAQLETFESMIDALPPIRRKVYDAIQEGHVYLDAIAEHTGLRISTVSGRLTELGKRDGLIVADDVMWLGPTSGRQRCQTIWRASTPEEVDRFQPPPLTRSSANDDVLGDVQVQLGELRETVEQAAFQLVSRCRSPIAQVVARQLLEAIGKPLIAESLEGDG